MTVLRRGAVVIRRLCSGQITLAWLLCGCGFTLRRVVSRHSRLATVKWYLAEAFRQLIEPWLRTQLLAWLFLPFLSV